MYLFATTRTIGIALEVLDTKKQIILCAIPIRDSRTKFSISTTNIKLDMIKPLTDIDMLKTYKQYWLYNMSIDDAEFMYKTALFYLDNGGNVPIVFGVEKCKNGLLNTVVVLQALSKNKTHIYDIRHRTDRIIASSNIKSFQDINFNDFTMDEQKSIMQLLYSLDSTNINICKQILYHV